MKEKTQSWCSTHLMAGTRQRTPLIHERLTLSWRYKQSKEKNNNEKAERTYHPWGSSLNTHIVLLRHHHIACVTSQVISLLKGTPHYNVIHAKYIVLAVTDSPPERKRLSPAVHNIRTTVKFNSIHGNLEIHQPKTYFTYRRQ